MHGACLSEAWTTLHADGEEFKGPFKTEYIVRRGRLYSLEYWWEEDWDCLPLKPPDAAVVGPIVISVTCKARS